MNTIAELELLIEEKDSKISEQASQIQRLSSEFFKMSQAQNEKRAFGESDEDVESTVALKEQISDLEEVIASKDEKLDKFKSKFDQLKEINYGLT